MCVRKKNCNIKIIVIILVVFRWANMKISNDNNIENIPHMPTTLFIIIPVIFIYSNVGCSENKKKIKIYTIQFIIN